MIRRALIAVLSLALLPSLAWACSCSNGGPRTAVRNSSAVYLGRLLKLGARHPSRARSVRTARLVVTLAVKGVHKADTVEVDADIGTSCGLNMRVGGEYLVYAVATPSDPTHLFTDYCAGTTSVGCAADDLKELAVAVPRRARSCRLRPPVAPRHHDPPPNVPLLLPSAQSIAVERMESTY